MSYIYFIIRTQPFSECQVSLVLILCQPGHLVQESNSVSCTIYKCLYCSYILIYLDSLRTQYEADLDNLNLLVDDIEKKVCQEIYDFETAYVRPGTTGGVICQTQAQEQLVVVKDTIAKAVVKYNILLDQSFTTKQDMEKNALYLDTASDKKIQKLNQKISKYEIVKDKITTSYSEYLEFTAVYKPDVLTHDPRKLDKAVKGAITSIDTLITELEMQDDERELATLLPRKSEKVNWPSFSGKPGESLFKFKEQFYKAAKQNQTSRADQLSKLRENLSDFPLVLIPETMENIQEAFKRLKDVYGDPQKLVNFELNKLKTVALFPNCDDGSYTMATRAQAEWLLHMETVLNELVKMGNDQDADRDLKRSVYGPQTTSLILAKFPSVLKQKLLSAAKTDPAKEKLDIFKSQIKEWSNEALEMEKYLPETEVSSFKTIQHVQSIAPVSGPSKDAGDTPNNTRPTVDTKAFNVARKKLKKRVRKSDNAVEVVPVPEGYSMFMFNHILKSSQGKHLFIHDLLKFNLTVYNEQYK